MEGLPRATKDSGARSAAAHEGHVAAGFDAVATAFDENFRRRGETGAAFALYRHGELVADLWGGVADAERGTRWDRQTIVPLFSATKGVTALCAVRAVESGQLDLDTPVAHYWPAFGAAGKSSITVRQVLQHEAGLAAVDRRLTLADVLAREPAVQALAEQPPNWLPGTRHGYHAFTLGWLLDELLRRATGSSVGALVTRDLATPLGLELWIGLPDTHRERVARLVPPESGMTTRFSQEVQDSSTLPGRVFQNPFIAHAMFNEPAVQRCEIPAVNGISDARSLARMYASMIGAVGGLRTVSEHTIEELRRSERRRDDAVLLMETSWALGFARKCQLAPMGGRDSFGHPGAGGSIGFADPQAGIAIGYVTNGLRAGLGTDVRSRALINACYESIEALPLMD